MASEIETAWAAGLFEGEGSFTSTKPSGHGRVTRGICMQLGMSDEDVVRRFHAVVGCGHVNYGKPFKPGWSSRFVWSAHGAELCQQIALSFWPHLGQRRRSRWLEVLRLYHETRPQPRECPECGITFTPHKVRTICCGNKCAKLRQNRFGGPYAGYRKRAPAD